MRVTFSLNITKVLRGGRFLACVKWAVHLWAGNKQPLQSGSPVCLATVESPEASEMALMGADSGRPVVSRHFAFHSHMSPWSHTPIWRSRALWLKPFGSQTAEKRFFWRTEPHLFRFSVLVLGWVWKRPYFPEGRSSHTHLVSSQQQF